MESAFDRNNGVIQSLLDTDYYTFTMMQAVLHQHPNVDVEYQFIVRSRESLVHLIPEIRQELEKLACRPADARRRTALFVQQALS